MNRPHLGNDTGLELGLVVENHLTDTREDGEVGLPLELLLGSGSVRSSSHGVVGRDLSVNDVDLLGEGTALLLNLLNDRSDRLSELEDGELVGVSDVDGSGLVSVHEEDKTIDEIVDVLYGDGKKSELYKPIVP